MSQQELSERANICRYLISEYENGKRTPNPQTIAKLAKAFDMPIEEFQKWVT